MEDSGGSGGSGGDGGDHRRPKASRSTRFGGLKEAAAWTSFTRGGSGGSGGSSPASVPAGFNLKRLAVSGLTSSLTSLEGEERLGNPFHEIGSRMKAALKRHKSKGINTASELQTNRRLSRRTRNSDPNIRRLSSSTDRMPEFQRGGNANPPGYMQLRNANVLSSQMSESSASAADNLLLASRLLEVTRKVNFCDVEVTGKDGVTVKAPSFLLACHSTVFEEIFYAKDGTEGASYPFMSQSDPKKIQLNFALHSAIEAAVHFCATLELPTDLESQQHGQASIRTICQLNLFAQLFKIPSLSNAAYRAARRIMNKSPQLVCAAFDELTLLMAMAESEQCWGLPLNINQDELRGYVLDFLRESPSDTIMGSNSQQMGVTFLRPASIEAIVCDEDLAVDEYTVWRILNLWVSRAPGSNDDKAETARTLMSHIQMVLIDPDLLKYQVKKCAYVNSEDVEKALKEIECILENDSPEDKERVIVEGAGDERVNGIYVLADDDIGLTREEVMFLKEGDAGEDDFHCSDFGLYRWGGEWGISNCTDSFEPLYTCQVSRRKGHTDRRPPKWGWKCAHTGAEPAPTCTWKPSKEDEADSFNKRLAPALSEIKVEKNRSVNDVHASCGHRLKSSLTLSQMMALPEDIDYSEDKDTFEYASAAKDLDAMMDLSVDEGHDDEEAGYDCNYMSAHLFYNPSTRSLKDSEDAKDTGRKPPCC